MTNDCDRRRVSAVARCATLFWSIGSIGSFLCGDSVAAAGDIPASIKKDLKAGEAEVRKSAARAAGKEGGDAVPYLLPVAANDKDSGVRDIAFTEITRLKTEVAVKHLVEKGLKSRDVAMRRTAAEALGAVEAPGVDAALLPLLADDDAAVRVAGAYASGLVKAAATRAALIELVENDGDALVRSVAVESVSRIGGDDTLQLLDRWMESPWEAVQMTALRQYWFHDKARGAEQAAAVLARKDLREDGPLRPLLVQAIEEAGRYRARNCLPRLVELLTHPRARARDLAWQMLGEITGLTIPNTPADWMDWWQHYGGGFEVPEKGRKRADPEQRSQVRFYGVPIVSDRIVFVIDYSGSMNEPGRDGRPKIDGARDALTEVLNALPDGTEFNIVAFSTAPRLWKQNLQRKTKSAVEQAIQFAKSTSPGGWTNVYDSLVKAIEQENADTVVLLSDGAPSIGTYQYFSRIRYHVRMLNRTRKVAVSSIALQTSDDAKRFLAELAKDTGGEYVER